MAGQAQPGAVELALAAPPVNLTPGPAYGDGTRRFQGIPGIERAANGRLWVVWYAGGPDGQVGAQLLARLRRERDAAFLLLYTLILSDANLWKGGISHTRCWGHVMGSVSGVLCIMNCVSLLFKY